MNEQRNDTHQKGELMHLEGRISGPVSTLNEFLLHTDLSAEEVLKRFAREEPE
jgi:hypothetical protein